jgi:hypothetical protein
MRSITTVVNGKARVREFAARVAAQGFLALTSYVVSITAAHSLNTLELAFFFSAWAIESLFIAAVRMVLLPAFVLTRSLPSLFGTLGMTLVCCAPFVVIAFVVAVNGLGPSTAGLLAATVITFGVYEAVRCWIIGTKRGGTAIAVSDTILFVMTAGGVLAVANTPVRGLATALVIVNVTALIMATFLARSQLRLRLSVVPMAAWAKDQAALLRLHVVEWAVFFIVSVAGLAILGFVGGPAVLTGVRLGETLAAPIGLLGSAIPLIVASYIGEIDARRTWSAPLMLITFSLMMVSGAWLALLQWGPSVLVSALVGPHVETARAASLGLALGALASLFIEVASLLEKRRKHLRFLHLVRLSQLITLAPLMAAGAAFQSVIVAALAMSTQQALPVFAFLVHGRRHRRIDK